MWDLMAGILFVDWRYLCSSSNNYSIPTNKKYTGTQQWHRDTQIAISLSNYLKELGTYKYVYIYIFIIFFLHKPFSCVADKKDVRIFLTLLLKT